MIVSSYRYTTMMKEKDFPITASFVEKILSEANQVIFPLNDYSSLTSICVYHEHLNMEISLAGGSAHICLFQQDNTSKKKAIIELPRAK